MKNILEHGFGMDEVIFDNKRQLRETVSEIFLTEDETLHVAETHVLIPKFSLKAIEIKRNHTRQESKQK